jgi:hypothetical protein
VDLLRSYKYDIRVGHNLILRVVTRDLDLFDRAPSVINVLTVLVAEQQGNQTQGLRGLK